MNLFSRLFHRDSYTPERDDLVNGLNAATEREQRRITEIRKQRNTGNFLADRLILPRPKAEVEKRGGDS